MSSALFNTMGVDQMQHTKAACNNNAHTTVRRRNLSSLLITAISVFVSAAVVLSTSPPLTSPSTSALFAFAGANTTAADDDSLPWVTFGYLRMQFADHSTVLTGYLSTLYNANLVRAVDGVRFRLNITTVDCVTEAECTHLTPEREAVVQKFLDTMHLYTAVIKTNYILAPRVIDRATALGGLPIVDPMTVRANDHAEGSPHVINFQPYITSEIAQIFTYMHQTAGCAYSGILYEPFSELTTHVPEVQRMFEEGGLPTPPSLDFLNADDDEIVEFLLEEDPRRKCFIMLLTYSTVMNVFTRLVQSGKYPAANDLNFYGPALASGGIYQVDGSGAAFGNMYFTRWSPELAGSNLSAAKDVQSYYDTWARQYVREAVHFPDPEGVPGYITDGTYLALFGLQFLIDSVRIAISEHHVGPFIAMSEPSRWAALLSVMYNNPRTIGGFPLLGRMTTSCPTKPLSQVCFCNRPSVTSYLFRINGATGIPSTVYDNETIGQRDLSSIENTACHQTVSSRSYPITSLLIRVPDDHVVTAGPALPVILGLQHTIDRVFNRRVRSSNYAPIAPARPLRYSPVTVDGSVTPSEALSLVTDMYNPFIIVGSLAATITESRILTFLPSITSISLEDAPLTPYNEWPTNIIQILPTVADFIHALASYYRENIGLYTSFAAIASTHAEAVLISKSMATFGFDIPVESISVSSSSLTWSVRLATWMEPEGAANNSNPFVLAVTTANPDGVLTSAFTIASSNTKGRLAVAADPTLLDDIRKSFTFRDNRDIFFGSFLPNFWAPSMQTDVDSDLVSYADAPVFWYAKVVNDIVVQLSNRVLYDYTTTAASILYSLAVVTSSNTAFGPFYNSECTAEQITNDDRDRDCQCTKGSRTIYVMSLKSWQNKVESTAATGGDYYYRMASCGVVYKPYVQPAADNSLSTGAIVGIAVGCSFAAIALLAALFLLNYFCLGRNNHNAPKDSTRAFAVVFTDIQASTALWARAPAAMSEAVEQHHAIMRKIIGKTNGYEVKTIGDSFMIAFKEPHDAVKFGLDAQEALFTAEWNSEINACYLEILAELAAAAAEAERAAASAIDEASSTTASNVDIISINGMPMPNQGGGGGRAPTSHSWVSGAHHTIGASAGMSVTGGMAIAPPLSKTSPAVLAAASPSDDADYDPADKKKALAVGDHQKTAHHRHDTSAPFIEGTAADSNLWNGLRVRIGISYGFGDIRKDPVTHGYDYYGTVVNTAARVEGVGHGGQVLITEETNNALTRDFVMSRNGIAISLGPQPLRGLDTPIKLTQISPAFLHARRYPPLRLHIEVDIAEESNITETTTTTTSSDAVTATPMELATQLCTTKQFTGVVSPEEIMANLTIVSTLLSPTKPKWQEATLAKLGDSWGFEKSAKAVQKDGSRLRLLVTIMGRVTKAVLINQRNAANGTARHNGLVGYAVAGANSSQHRGGGGGRSGSPNNNRKHTIQSSSSNNSSFRFSHTAAAAQQQQQQQQGGGATTMSLVMPSASVMAGATTTTTPTAAGTTTPALGNAVQPVSRRESSGANNNNNNNNTAVVSAFAAGAPSAGGRSPRQAAQSSSGLGLPPHPSPMLGLSVGAAGTHSSSNDVNLNIPTN